MYLESAMVTMGVELVATPCDWSHVPMFSGLDIRGLFSTEESWGASSDAGSD